jgi:hypothetical protein
MESKYGVKGTILEDIFFTEDIIPNFKIIKHLHLEMIYVKVHQNVSPSFLNISMVLTYLIPKSLHTSGIFIFDFLFGSLIS